jgi:RNA polymerase sigma-B factor
VPTPNLFVTGCPLSTFCESHGPPPWVPPPHHLGNEEYTRWVLHVRFAEGDESALAPLVESYRRYVASLARRFLRHGEPLDDLIQVASEALVVAIRRFDPDRGIRFLAFATPTIVGALKRHYRDLGWSIRVPRRVHELAAPAREASERLTASLGRKPTVAEVAKAVGVDEETLLSSMEAVASRTPQSLDALEDEGRPGAAAPGRVDGSFARSEDRMVLISAFRELPATDRALVEQYYFRGMSQSAIAENTGVSQMQVSRLLAKAVGRLRASMVA